MKTCVDAHSHILPQMDDGSRSVEETLQMLRMEAEQGVSRVLATPHFYAHLDSPELFLERREKAWQMLRGELETRTGLPEVTLGAEVHYYPGMSNSEALRQLTIGESGYLLLEMPPAPWTESMYREMEDIYSKQGIIPIIAHVDRYITPFRTHGIPKRLRKLPVLVQANSSFFLHSATARMALRMLNKDQIHLLGSDCHDLQSRKPKLGEAVEQIRKKLGEEALDRIREYENMVCAKEED